MNLSHFKFDKDILWSTFIQLAGKIGQMVLGIMAVKLLTNALGPDNYGVYGKISEFSLFFATAANLGIFGNIIRKISEDPKNGSLFANGFFLRALTALLFFATGFTYALIFIEDSLFLAGTLLFMGSLLFDYLTTVCTGILQAHYRMGRATFALLSGRLMNLGMIYALTHGIGFFGEISTAHFFLAPLLSAVLTLTLTFYFARQVLKPKWEFNKTLQLKLLWTSLPFGIINITNNLYFRFIPSALLAKILSDSMYGLYDLSLSISATVSLLSTLFMFSVLPKLKHHLSEKNWKESGALYKNARTLLMLGAIGVIGFGSWLAPLALTLVSSKDFLDPVYWFILPLLLVLAGVSYFYDLAFLTLFALNKDITWMKQEILVLMGSLGLFTLAFKFGPTAPAQAILILTTAIVAEATMALWGMKKAERLLVTNAHSNTNILI